MHAQHFTFLQISALFISRSQPFSLGVRGNGLCLQQTTSMTMVEVGPNTWRIDLVYNSNEYGMYCPALPGVEPLLTGRVNLHEGKI